MRYGALLFVIPFLVRSELLPIRSYTTADGLAADRVDGIVADSRGFLWFCTAEGLSRFDGYRFVNYGSEEGLPHRFIESMIATRSGDHWIGTPRGLSRISNTGGGARFTNVVLAPEPAANNIGSLLELRSGAILAATEAGLFESGDSSNFRRRDLAGIEKLAVTDIAEDGGGGLWIASTTGIYRYRAGAVVQSFDARNGLPGDWAQILRFDAKGRLWAGVRGGLAMIAGSDDGNWSVEKVYSYNTGLIGSDVKALHVASDGTIWVGTQFGISRLSWTNGGDPTIENLTRDQGLSDRMILSLAEDHAGNIWAGTEGAGVMQIGRGGFTTYRERDGLATDRVFSVLEDRAGGLLAVTAGPGKKTHAVNLFDGVRFHSVSPGGMADYPTWGFDRILLQSRSGEWWAATDRGLCRFGAVKPAELDRRAPLKCYANNTVFRIFEDSKGGIWASGQSPSGDWLMRWDPQTQQPVLFPAPRSPGGRKDDLVSAFAEDRQGNIWMGQWAGGLYRYDGQHFQFFQKSDGLAGGTIFALFSEGDVLWAGSNNGLSRIDQLGSDHPHIETFNIARGLASNIVTCIVTDREGRVYAGTGKGVDRLDPQTGHIRHFSSADGLAHGVFKSAWRDRNGALWFATTQGLSKLIPSYDKPVARPRIFITDLRLGSQAYPVSQAGETRISKLELEPSANQLQVDFVGINDEDSDSVHYSYKLEGADSQWSAPRAQRAVNYAALKDGTYHFLVKAVTSEGVESAIPAQVDFVVLPPVWRRWWFEGIALALTFGVVFAAHRYRVAQAVSLERMRTAIATDLHDDIGASLSQIAILSEVARVNANGHGSPGEPLERVATLAREVIDSMGDIVWSIHSEGQGIDSLIRRMREFAIDLLSSQGIDFELEAPRFDKNVELDLQARRQVFLMFKECIHNAARHSRCTRVVAQVALADREAFLTIEDNGTGLRQQEKTRGWNGGLGLSNVRRRSAGLGGRMELISKPGEGCRVEIRFPLRSRPFV
ncbi:MAG TPA: two-component regulator propeller domain-containing protein [Bryobacteraceae bacterium]|nr:two-component regulator propeller domain-containing protein [Bryobacteraceae bacterium]